MKGILEEMQASKKGESQKNWMKHIKDVRWASLTTANDMRHFNSSHLSHVATGKLEPICLPPLEPSSLVVPEFEWPGFSLVSDDV